MANAFDTGVIIPVAENVPPALAMGAFVGSAALVGDDVLALAQVLTGGGEPVASIRRIFGYVGAAAAVGTAVAVLVFPENPQTKVPAHASIYGNAWTMLGQVVIVPLSARVLQATGMGDLSMPVVRGVTMGRLGVLATRVTMLGFNSRYIDLRRKGLIPAPAV